MSRKRTLGRLLCLFVFATQGAAETPSLQERFADCAGRLSAQMEFQWLMSDPDADRTMQWRNAMADLLDAMTEPGAGPAYLSIRISAKQAHTALLARGTFNADPNDAAWALRRADRQIAQCTGFLLM